MEQNSIKSASTGEIASSTHSASMLDSSKGVNSVGEGKRVSASEDDRRLVEFKKGKLGTCYFSSSDVDS